MGYTVNGLINTSVEDCKSTLAHIDDLDLLTALHAQCLALGQPSRLRIVAARIRQLKMRS